MVTFTEEILNGKLRSLFSGLCYGQSNLTDSQKMNIKGFYYIKNYTLRINGPYHIVMMDVFGKISNDF